MPIHDWRRVPDGVFHAFHIRWLGQLQEVLNTRLLPDPFYALTETVTGEAVPDVITLQARPESGPDSAADRGIPTGGHVLDDSMEGAVALAPCPALIQELDPAPYDRLARRIVIRSDWEGDAVVAVVELVSRGNKTSQLKAEQVVKKVFGFLEKGIHILLIDLHGPTPAVPEGFHPLVCGQYGDRALPVPPDRCLSAVSYQVFETGRIRSHAVPLKAGDSLPEMPVFLEPHKFVRVPLEETYAAAFPSVPRKFQVALEAALPRAK